MGDFWERCIAAGVVIVPVKVYSGYNAYGNLDEAKCIGIRFAALDAGLHAVAPDFWFMVEAASAGDRLFDSAEGALLATERRRDRTYTQEELDAADFRADARHAKLNIR